MFCSEGGIDGGAGTIGGGDSTGDATGSGVGTAGATHLPLSQMRSPLQSVSLSQPVPPNAETNNKPNIPITPP
ncbi:MAG: hypothetical protein Q8K32_33165 [Archangium sp.]|nr:hypothetical protein [Archangium sp.]